MASAHGADLSVVSGDGGRALTTVVTGCAIPIRWVLANLLEPPVTFSTG